MTQPRSKWQLPPGISPGVWDYTQADFIATDYDSYFANHDLLRFDHAVVDNLLTDPGLVVDFGCGTGRSLFPLVNRGFSAIGVDLSNPMLESALAKKDDLQPDRISFVRANLVQLDCFASEIADYGICLFSTLGMIEKHENRLKFLGHVHRILKPGGLFVLHVHNQMFNLYDPGGPWWLLKSFFARLRGGEFGDRIYHYRGINRFFLHTFGKTELKRLLKNTGLRITEWIPLNRNCSGRLEPNNLFETLRASGWIVACRRQS